MTADERLALLRVKIERARKHVSDLEIEVRSFLATGPYVVGTKRNPQTRQLVYYVVNVRETPITVPAIASDALQNLRSALDHLAYQLVLVGGASPTKQTCFPISDDAAKYKTEQPQKVKGMRPDAIRAIDAIKPYKGGDDTLWRLHKLNNIDKHRALITVGSAFHGVNLGAHMMQKLREVTSSNPAFSSRVIPELDFFVSPADRLCPLKAGDELFIDAPDAEVNEKMQFSFDVSFGEPQISEGDRLLETLQRMAELVDNIALSFKPLLA